MFKKILVPTDGSELSDNAVRQAISFAKESRAALLFVHVLPEYVPAAFAEFPAASQASFADFMQATEETAKNILGKAEAAAKAAGVASEACTIRHGQAWKAIIDVCRERGTDLIFMASHGRRGLSALVLGSETQKVLTHSSTPVLVFR